MRDYTSLVVWQKARRLTLGVYRLASVLPASERFELSSQLRRAAVSIEANLAEACGHSSDREVARFFQMAMASASELQCEISLTLDLELTDNATAARLTTQVIEVKRILAAIIVRLRRRIASAKSNK